MSTPIQLHEGFSSSEDKVETAYESSQKARNYRRGYRNSRRERCNRAQRNKKAW